VVHVGLATVLCLLFSFSFLSVSRLCLRIVSPFFFSFLPIPVRLSDRPPAGRIQSPPRLSAAMAALALAAIEVGRAFEDVRFRVAAMPVAVGRWDALGSLAWPGPSELICMAGWLAGWLAGWPTQPPQRAIRCKIQIDERCVRACV
jgi:hypothetical protein